MDSAAALASDWVQQLTQKQVSELLEARLKFHLLAHSSVVETLAV